MTLVFLKSTRTACTYYTCGRVHGTRRVCNFYRHSVIVSRLYLLCFLFCFIRMQRYNIFKQNPSFSPTTCYTKLRGSELAIFSTQLATLSAESVTFAPQ